MPWLFYSAFFILQQFIKAVLFWMCFQVTLEPMVAGLKGSSSRDGFGKLQMQRKDYNDARATYKKILRIVPDSVEAKYQLMWLEK